MIAFPWRGHVPPLLLQGIHRVTSSRLVLPYECCWCECVSEDEAGRHEKNKTKQNAHLVNSPYTNRFQIILFSKTTLHFYRPLTCLCTCFPRDTTYVRVHKQEKWIEKTTSFKVIKKITKTESINTLQITITIIETPATWY